MIQVNDLRRNFLLYKDEYEKKALEVLNSGWYVLGNEVQSFEQEFAKQLDIEYAIGVDNGLNAIFLGLKALGIGVGDEVIMQSNSYIATILAVTHNGATPVLVEPDKYYSIDTTKIEEKITEKTKAVIVTHLYGQPADMEPVVDICKKNNLYLFEDCAQAHFAKYNGKNVGTFGDMGFFSFYPTKNLGGFGDGGAIALRDQRLANKLKALRNYGSEKKYHNMYEGFNCRLDEMQAGLLRVKLSHINEIIERRCNIAEYYVNNIKNPLIELPKVRRNTEPVWHLFVIQCEYRDELKTYMEAKGIKTDVHYPIPPHLSEAYKGSLWNDTEQPLSETLANTVLSLPIYEGLTVEEAAYIVEVINKFHA